MLQALLFNLLAVSGMHTVVWMLSLARRDASVVDLFWGLGFVLIGWLTWWQSGDASVTGWVLLFMVTVWGLRLSGYLTWRNWGKKEDPRYAAMRERHGDRFPWVSLATVFLLQALLTWIIALPLQVGIARGGGFGFATLFGAALWAAGLFFEAVGDWQLARFKADPANSGGVMSRGLWRYTRHPNYFGDFLVWWGIWLVSTGCGVVAATLIAPVLMTFLLLRVSGVTLLERSLKTRVAGYEEYVESTSPFFPWPPKKNT